METKVIDELSPYEMLEVRLSRCIECGSMFSVVGRLHSDTCGRLACVRAYLKKGKGSVNYAEYKQYMSYCYELLEGGGKGFSVFASHDVHYGKVLGVNIVPECT